MQLSPHRNDGFSGKRGANWKRTLLTTAALMLSFCGQLNTPAQAFSSFAGTPPASLPIKDTDYAIPNGAVFAAPSSTADLASGSTSSVGKDTNAGTLASPWTLTKALSSSADGATIVLRGGNYRALNLSFSRRNTVQAYPHEKPWVRGDLVVPPAEFSANGALTAAPLVFCAGDATVQDGSSAGSTGTTGTNYGNATELAVKTSGGTGLNRDAYLKFGLNFTTNITRARLRFYAKSSDASTIGTNLYSVATTSWVETGSNSITWSNKPARSSTALGSANVAGTTLTAYDIDVTSYVQAQKTAGSNTISFALHNPNASTAAIAVNASENTDAATRPVLLIDAATTTWSTPTKPTSGVNAGKNFEWGIATDDNHYYDKTSVGRPDELDYTPGFREILFIDGTPIDQVDSLDQVTPTTFYVDRTTHQLHIGVDPAGKVIEMNASARGLNSSKANSVIRGLGFMRFADEGVRLQAQEAVLENCTSIWNGQTGMSAGGSTVSGMMIRGNLLACNGRTGGTASDTDSIVFENNVFYYNNVENFTSYWGAAGIKVARLRDATFRGNVFQDNDCTGLWMDISVLRAKVYRNIAIHNASIGLFFEISHDCVFAFNVCVNNGAGIMLSGSSGVRVYNNTLIKNSTNLVVKDSGRSNNPFVDGGGCGGGGPLDGDPYECGEDYASYAAGADWAAHDNIIKNNILWGSRSSGGFLLDGTTNNKYNPATGSNSTEASSIMFAALDYNAYYRAGTGTPSTAVKWFESGYKTYATLAAFKNDYDTAPSPSYEAKGVAVDSATDPFFQDGANGNYLLKSGSPASGTGEAIPADIAALVGVPSAPANMGAFGSAPSLPPSNLTATATSADRINLTWQDNAQNESGFRIERSLDGTNFSSLTTVGPNVVAYADKNLAPNTLYYYRVRAFDPLAARATATDPQGESAPTNVANATTGNFVTREAVADAQVRNDEQTTRSGGLYTTRNYGGSTALESKFGTPNSELRDVYFKFDLSGLNAIVDATLKLYLSNANTYGVTTAIYPLANPSTTWIEGTSNGATATGGSITWSNRPAKAASALAGTSQSIPTTTGAWYEWDVTDYLRSEKEAGRTSVTLVVSNSSSGSSLPLVITSKEATGAQAGNHPQLILNASTVADTAAVVAAQSYVATEDLILTVPASDGVLKGAADAEGNALTAVLMTGTTNGAVSLRPDGSFLYRPKNDFNGTDTFSFAANDGVLDSTPKTVTITVAAINDAPRHKHPAAPSDQPGLLQATSEDTPLVLSSDTTGGRLANNVSIDDIDLPSGSPLTLKISLRGIAGRITLKQTTGLIFSSGDGTNDYSMTFVGTESSINAALNGMTYTPLAHFAGRGGVRFMSNDANASDATIGNFGAGGPLISQTVLPIIVAALNDPPTANDDSFTVTQNSSANTLAVLTNDDTRPDAGESLVITSVTPATSGTVTISADQKSLLYTPNSAYTGTDACTYTINDRADGSGQSDTATAAISVVPAATGAADVTAQVGITRQGFDVSFETGRWLQLVVVKNTGATTISGPLYLMLDGLGPTGVDLWNKSGTTTFTGRAGYPFINLQRGSLAPGASTSVVLEFTNTANAAISYTPRALSGPGKP